MDPGTGGAISAEIIKYVWQTILTLGLIILFLLKNPIRRNKKNENPGYAVKIAKLETKVENIEDDIREIKKKLNRK